MIHDIKWTRWTVKDLRFMFGQVYELVYKPCVCGLGWLWREFCLTLRFFKLPGLVGDGLGDFAEWGVDSWLSGAPIHYKEKGEKCLSSPKEKVYKVCEWSSANISRAPRRLPVLLYSKSELFKSLSVSKKRRNRPHSCSCFLHSHP